MTAPAPSRFRRALPAVLVLLCIAASVLAATPWLQAFPLLVAGAPLYGAAVLSVLVPLSSWAPSGRDGWR